MTVKSKFILYVPNIPFLVSILVLEAAPFSFFPLVFLRPEVFEASKYKAPLGWNNQLLHHSSGLQICPADIGT